MTSFWSGWIIVLTVFSLIATFLIIVLNLKNYTHVGEGESMGHEFDGIEELNNPLPKWWTYMFYFLLAWSVGYLVLFPGLGNWQGTLGWKSSNQSVRSLEESRMLSEKAKAENLFIELDQEYKRADETYGPVFKAIASKPILELVETDAVCFDRTATPMTEKACTEESLADNNTLVIEPNKVGQRLYLQNCALCHGSDARGSTGFPNLTDKDWLYGGSPEQIKTTLLHGRIAAMPAWASLGEENVDNLTEYVLKLAGRKVNDKKAEAGKAMWGTCAACHGADGKGSLANGLPFGAPNLTDNIWLYGGSRKAVKESLMLGRNGVMPPWQDVLGEDKVHVISSYIYSLSN